jgi:hypothetical protein
MVVEVVSLGDHPIDRARRDRFPALRRDRLHGERGLRLSPDQRPWQLPLLLSVRFLRGGSKRWKSG